MESPQAGRQTKFMSFSGIDGAGKTTQITVFCARMRRSGLRVRLVTFWDDVAQLTSIRESAGHKLFNGDKGVGSPNAPINRRDKNVRSWPMSCLRLFLYFLDTVSVRKLFRESMASDADLVVFDRYIYDELANLNLSNPLIKLYVRLIMNFVPRPQISFLLDADPVQARARKPEYPLDFLCANRQSYLTLNKLVPGMTVVPPMPVHDVTEEILRQAERKLSLS